MSVVGAAVSYIITSAPNVRKSLTWEDKVEVLQFTSRKGVTAANTGDGAVFLSHIRLVAKNSDDTHLFTRTLQLDQVVENGKVVLLEGDDSKRLTKGQLLIPRQDSDEAFKAAMSDSGDLAAVEAGKKCFLWVVYHDANPMLQGYRERMGEELRYFSVTARLFFRSLVTKKTHFVDVPVTGILHMADIERCRRAYLKERVG